MEQGLLELAEALMTSSERRLELTSRNVSNLSTPGYKRIYSFDQVAGASNATAPPPVAFDHSQGGLAQTGAPLDVAILGEGFFQLRSDHGVYFTRNGQFRRGEDGRVQSAQGFTLQTSSGEDLIITSDNFEIAEDGTVFEYGTPLARIGVFSPKEEDVLRAVSGSLLQADEDRMGEHESALIRQGALETSNTALAQEMLDMMQILRAAEAGARIVQTYDSLMSQSISTLGRTS